MVKILQSIILSLFLITCKVEAQIINNKEKEKIININCKACFNNKRSMIKIMLQNTGKSNIYVYLSYWEINGLMKETDFLLGFPYDSYTVNRIFFVPQTMNINKGMETRGDKAEYPIFKNFPNILKLSPKESQILIIQFSDSILQNLQMNLYQFSCTIAFTNNKEWKILENKIGKKIRRSIIAVKEEVIIIKLKKFMEPDECMISDIKIKPEYSGIIRRTFDNFITGHCDLDTND